MTAPISTSSNKITQNSKGVFFNDQLVLSNDKIVASRFDSDCFRPLILTVRGRRPNIDRLCANLKSKFDFINFEIEPETRYYSLQEYQDALIKLNKTRACPICGQHVEDAVDTIDQSALTALYPEDAPLASMGVPVPTRTVVVSRVLTVDPCGDRLVY